MLAISSAYGFGIGQSGYGLPQDSSGTAGSGEISPPGGRSGQPNSGSDPVTLSAQGLGLSANNSTRAKTSSTKSTVNGSNQAAAARDLELISKLKKRDADVRSHEQAHIAVAGRYAAGAISYTYQTGPDGVRYAIGGEVPIDLSSESTPQATIQKMETVRRAALAPSDPSSADLRIASEASSKELQAMQELQTQQTPKAEDSFQASSSINSSGASASSSAKAPSAPANDAATVGDSKKSAGGSTQLMIQTYQAMASII